MIYTNKDMKLREKIFDFITYDDEMNKKIKEYYIPNNLYKYKSLNENSINALENSYEFSSNPLNFNDIFDSRNNIDYKDVQILKDKYFIENTLKLDSKDKTLLNFKDDTFIKMCAEKTIYNFEYMTSIHRIICFSEIYNSNLMWSHYAYNHTGICLQYRAKELVEFREYIYPVKYIESPINTSSLKIFDIYKFDIYKYDYEVELDNLISLISKSNDWSYEKEWRFIIGEIAFGKFSEGEKINFPNPYKILLGSKFFEILNILFNNKNEKDRDKKLSERFSLSNRLFEFALKNNIEIEMLIPVIGTYKFEKVHIESKKINDILTNKKNDHIKIIEINKYIKKITINNYINKF